MPPSFIWKLRDYIQTQDPGHPTTLVLVRAKKAWDYGPGVDIVMVDPYPIPKMPVTWLSESIEEAKKAVFNQKPIWAVVQAFDWSAYPYGEERREWGRNPTYEEERCLTYLSLVHGAKGIFYYTFRGGNYFIKDYPSHWEELKEIVKELNQIYPLLLAPPEINFPAFKWTQNKSVHYLIKKVDKDLSFHYNNKSIIKPGRYLIAVNVTNKSVKTSLTIPNYFEGKAKILFEDREISITDGEMNLHFNPYGVYILKLEK
ncbi:MAG: hypothetical protein DRG25_02935 [Deltaproteobacteria bacterium]|nr:MAG: hypothetical protein DRG25_02935 [Deltaproteobacteria bacterium]